MKSLINVATDFGAHLYKEHPRIVVFVLLVSIATFYSSTVIFAQTTQVDQKFSDMQQDFNYQIRSLEAKVDDLKADLERVSDEQTRNFQLIEINNLEREIYQIEQLIESGEANQRDRERLVQIRSTYNESVRQLNAIPINN